MTTNPSPDAVEALTKAIEIEWNAILKFTAVKLIGHLAAQGFTIVRQPAMTDAELEAEIQRICSSYGEYGVDVSDNEDFLVELAKKYRG